MKDSNFSISLKFRLTKCCITSMLYGPSRFIFQYVLLIYFCICKSYLCCGPQGGPYRSWKFRVAIYLVVSFSLLNRLARYPNQQPCLVPQNVNASVSNVVIPQTPVRSRLSPNLVPRPQLVMLPFHFPSARSSTNAIRFLNRQTWRS